MVITFKFPCLSAVVPIVALSAIATLSILSTTATATTTIATTTTTTTSIVAITPLSHPQCNLVPCPAYYPATNECVLANPFEPPYLLSVYFPRDKILTMAECLQYFPSYQSDFQECNGKICHGTPERAGTISHSMMCEFKYEDCLKKHGPGSGVGVDGGRPFRCEGATGKNRNKCVCTPCGGVAMLPVNVVEAAAAAAAANAK
ncbi:MAG: hypothetical protein J3R72DRAFT_442694 [Linnemannia gamsii]|nr:MAG: hypothetical protein J3R72DRAFT_442694 [Linnemannia gamsii]